MTLTLDTSVILKWLIRDPEREPDTDKATVVVEAVIAGRVDILQPTHWLAEVAAVLARLSPQTALDDVEMLAGMEFPSTEHPQVMRRATLLAIDTRQHLFDTFYHAVALEHGTTLLTADERYRTKADAHGQIVALHAWAMPA